MFPVRHQFLAKKENNYLEAIAILVLQLHKTKPKGDILVFLPGEKEIMTIINTVNQLKDSETLEMMPLFANLSQQEQLKIFEPSNMRRCICSTNIAETSLTVPNISFIIDSGFVRTKIFDF